MGPISSRRAAGRSRDGSRRRNSVETVGRECRYNADAVGGRDDSGDFSRSAPGSGDTGRTGCPQAREKV